MNDPGAVTAALLAWFARAQRDLPWRRTRDPYRIWVSEIMLQQTQVATVIPYYERFLERFPTVCALAGASLDQVLSLWQGLGYYARARHLHAAAQQVCERYDGVLPADVHALLKLPGVGEYTAGAIASIAYQQDVLAIDGNVVRVLCRLTDEERRPSAPGVRARLRALGQTLLPPGQAGAYNQALMELGATVCTPSSPDCRQCPLAAHCLAHARGTQAQRPVPEPRRQPPLRQMATAIIEREGRLLIVRRVPSGLLGGLWETPGVEVAPGEQAPLALAQGLHTWLELDVGVEAELAVVRHAYTHLRVQVRAYRANALGAARTSGPWDAVHWLAPGERAAYGLTGVTTRLLDRIPWAGSTLLL